MHQGEPGNKTKTPPPANNIEPLLGDANERARQLAALVAHWDPPSLSRNQNHSVLKHLHNLKQDLQTRKEIMQDIKHRVYGTADDRVRTLFWDKLDPNIKRKCASPFAFQMEHVEEIERRCAKQRVGRVAGPSSAQRRKLKSIHTSVCRIYGLDFDLSMVCIPQVGIPWSESTRIHCGMAALRQLALSPHFPAYFGQDLMPDVPLSESPPIRYFVELVNAPRLALIIENCGPIDETSPLHAFWRRQIIEAATHISTQCTHIPIQSLELRNVRAAEKGSRLVVTGLDWGPSIEEGHTTSAKADQVSKIVQERDAALLQCSINLVIGLSAPANLPIGRLPGGASTDLQLLCEAARSVAPPTLSQMLSHPYFAPLSPDQSLTVKSDAEQLVASYERKQKENCE